MPAKQLTQKPCSSFEGRLLLFQELFPAALKTARTILKAILSALLFFSFFSASASYGFDSKDYVLSLPGHINTLTADSQGNPVVTCDFKTLEGRVPPQGEPCDGSPRLFIPKADMESLRYIAETFDNNELVRRAYERFDKIAFIFSPDFAYDFTNSPYLAESFPVSVLPPGISKSDYDYFATRVQNVLYLDGRDRYGTTYALGAMIPPYAHPQPLGVDPTTYPPRPLPEYCLMLLPKNPDRTTLLHELFHCLIEQAAIRQIRSTSRYQSLQAEADIAYYLNQEILRDNLEASIERLGEDMVAAYQLTFELFRLHSNFHAIASELEVTYFFSRYGTDLGLSQQGIESHWNEFWAMTDNYLFNLQLNRSQALSSPAYEAVRENRDFIVDGTVYENYFAYVSGDISYLAKFYQKNILGDEHRPEPGTLMDRFINEIGPRSKTQTWEQKN